MNGRVATLSRFVAQATDKFHPFFQALKEGKDFVWYETFESAFQELKQYLGTPLLLSKPRVGKELFLYLAVSEHDVSFVIVWEEEKIQQPIFYVSKALIDPETRYTEMEKLALALETATKKLRPYFLAHKVMVLTSYPLKKVLEKVAIKGTRPTGTT